MMGKERWRKHLGELDLKGYVKAWIGRGLKEIHHEKDHMDGRMDACLGYSAVIRAEAFKAIKELEETLVKEQKKRLLDGWERMDVKRRQEDSLKEAQNEIADLKTRVDTLEFHLERLTRLTPSSPKEAFFCVASPLPDIGFPPADVPSKIPGLTANQAIVDDFLDWSAFDRSWPHGGYEADCEKEGGSDKENEWVPVPVDE